MQDVAGAKAPAGTTSMAVMVMAELRAACCVGSFKFQMVKVPIIMNFAISSAEVDALSCVSDFRLPA